MPMLYIVLTACLVSSPDACEERYIPLYADISPMACMMGAQAEIARWQQTHADLDVSRWQCKTDEMIALAETPGELDVATHPIELE